MTIRLEFDNFTPRFWAPISTSSDQDIAVRFAGGRGIILKLETMQSSNDEYFNPEVFSNYPDEKEKLFMKATKLEIMDIEYFQGGYGFSCKKYIKGFKLLSNLLDGNYVFIPSKIRSLGPGQRILVKLIKNYKKYNQLEYKYGNDCIKIGVYVQQLLFNQLDKLHEQEDGLILLNLNI